MGCIMPESTAAQKFGVLWCAFAHDSAMWPIHGQYRCRTCGRHYPVPWAGGQTAATAITCRVRPARRESRPSAPRCCRSRCCWPSCRFRGFVRPACPSCNPPCNPTRRRGWRSRATSRTWKRADFWTLETVEIDASLPKLEKHGRLRAIRRRLPLGKPSYQVLEIAGDQTVSSR